MRQTDSETTRALDRLAAALAAPEVPSHAATRCRQLVENLRRPVRVGLFGRPGAGSDQLISAILGFSPVPPGYAWPTLEVTRGATPRVTATLADASALSRDGLPAPDLMDSDPVFMSINATAPVLDRMSFLFLAESPDPGEQLAALAWAESRTDIAIWVSRSFEADEAQLWADAPEALKNHAFLVTTGAADSGGHRSAGLDFDGVFAVDLAEASGLDWLMARLEADIDDAISADMDAARVFLHRLGLPSAVEPDAPAAAAPAQPDRAPPEPDEPLTGETAAPAPAPAPAPTPATNATPRRADPAVLRQLSEPFLYLKRRARALMEIVDWTDPETEDWPANILTHCCDTTEGLRERAANWSDDTAGISTLRDSLDEACDMAVLLQIEGGAAQAKDAATMLLQLRGDFERELAA